MLDKETSDKLQASVIQRLTQNLSNDSGTDQLIQSMVRLAALVSVITLEEYEKLNR